MQFFSKFIQTQKKYSNSLDKKGLRTWLLLFISSQKFSCEPNSLKIYPLQNIPIASPAGLSGMKFLSGEANNFSYRPNKHIVLSKFWKLRFNLREVDTKPCKNFNPSWIIAAGNTIFRGSYKTWKKNLWKYQNLPNF